MRRWFSIQNGLFLVVIFSLILAGCQPGGVPQQGPAGAATLAAQTEQAAAAIASAVAEISTAGAQTATSAAASESGSTLPETATNQVPFTATSEAPPVPSETSIQSSATPESSATPPAPGVAWIVFLQDRDVALVNSIGAASSLLTNTPFSEFLPAWSPDGSQIAFLRTSSLSSPGWQLMVVNADGSNLKALDDGKQEFEWLWWVDNGRSLLVQQGNSTANTYYSINADSSERKLIAEQVIERPVLSSDHNRALFLITSNDTCNGKGCVFPADVYVYDFEKDQLSQVTVDGEPKYGVSWSPDEASIAYQTEAITQTVIYHRVDKTIDTVNQPPWWVNPWVLSPDGRQIAFAQGKAVYIKGEGQNQDRKVFELPPIQESPSSIDSIFWYPDNSGLVVGQWVALYAFTFAGNELQQLPVYLENIFFDVRPVAGNYVPPPVPTPLPDWNPCPDAPRSRLGIGDKAQVSTNPPYPNNVRLIPDKNGNLVGKIQPGEQIEIISGPYCSNNWVWWRIKSLQSGLEGWTAEGDAEAYWLVPLP